MERAVFVYLNCGNRLLPAMLSKYNQTPNNVTLWMSMMILWWQWLSLFGYDLPSAYHAAINARVWRDRSWCPILIERSICLFLNKRIVLIHRHYLGSFFHRAFAAFAAIWERFFGPNLAALASPPRRPPSLPSATACGFLAGSTGLASLGSNFGASPMDSRKT